MGALKSNGYSAALGGLTSTIDGIALVVSRGGTLTTLATQAITWGSAAVNDDAGTVSMATSSVTFSCNQSDYVVALKLYDSTTEMAQVSVTPATDDDNAFSYVIDSLTLNIS